MQSTIEVGAAADNIMINIIAVIATLICSVHAHHVFPSFRRLAFIPRGGSAADADEIVDGKNIDVSPINNQVVGVIDLRPTPEPDRIILNINGEATIQQSIFPTADEDESANIEDEMDVQAANTHSIGSVCSTIYLIISYDFENGKTVLHRNYGGAKLMSFIDGARSRTHDDFLSSGRDANGTTKLVLLLVPSSSSAAIALLSNLSDTSKSIINNKVMLNLTNNDEADWDTSGAIFLVDRLSEAFTLGGDEYQNIAPFAVEMVGVFDIAGQEEMNGDTTDTTDVSNDDSYTGMNEVALRHHAQSQCLSENNEQSGTRTVDNTSDECFKDLIAETYTVAGGKVENVNFQ